MWVYLLAFVLLTLNVPDKIDQYTINASQLPYVALTQKEQFNFTLKPDPHFYWSKLIDFDIVPNRLPHFTLQFDYQHMLRQLLIEGQRLNKQLSQLEQSNTIHALDRYFKIFSIKSDDLNRHDPIGMGFGIPRKNEKSQFAFDPHMDRVRIVILAGLGETELVSTEIAVRFMRHLIHGLARLDVRTLELITMSQILIIPNVASAGLDRVLRQTQLNQCPVTSNPSSLIHDSIFDQGQFKDLMSNFQPHLVFLMQSTTDQLDNQSSLKSIHLPTNGGTNVLFNKLFETLNLAYQKSLDRTVTSGSCQTGHNSVSFDGIEQKIVEFFTSNDAKQKPMIVRIPMGCATTCPVHVESELPNIWYQNLLGLNDLFSAVRNLSFCGHMMVESSSIIPNDEHRRFFYHSKWTVVDSVHLEMRPLQFLMSNNKTYIVDEPQPVAWFSIPIAKRTGQFCQLIFPGTYLTYGAAGLENSSLFKAYENMAMVISFRSDRFNGKFQIKLEKKLEEIRFSDPHQLYKRMQNYTKPMNNGVTCGKMEVIGHSHLGRPIYAFQMGQGITIGHRNRTRLVDTARHSNASKTFDVDDLEDDLFDVFKLSPTHGEFVTRMVKVAVIGNLHGYDRLAPQLLVHFISLMCDNHDHLDEIDDLLDDVQMTFVPVPNPDGLFLSWQSEQLDKANWLEAHPVSCYASENKSFNNVPVSIKPVGMTNNADVDLWEQLITFTKSNVGHVNTPWWFPKSNMTFEPENVALIQLLRGLQPNAILTLPSASRSDIGFGFDPFESSYGHDLMYSSYSWLKYLAKLLSPGFHFPPKFCQPFYVPQSIAVSSSDRRRRPGQGQLDMNHWLTHVPMALSLASVRPTTDERQLQSSASFPQPLSILAPPSLALSLCPGCAMASPTGVARVWTDFRLPNLLIGLMRHATLTALGSWGLNGQVKDASSNRPISWVRIHLDFVNGELTTGPVEQDGQFSLLLPPGVYRISFRAVGYLDQAELITIDPIKSPVYHVFYMQSVGGFGSSSNRILVVHVVALAVAILLSLFTCVLCYRFCCTARTPYAVVRRTLVTSNVTKSDSRDDQPKMHPKHNAYQLLNLNDERSDANRTNVRGVGDEDDDDEQATEVDSVYAYIADGHSSTKAMLGRRSQLSNDGLGSVTKLKSIFKKPSKRFTNRMYQTRGAHLAGQQHDQLLNELENNDNHDCNRALIDDGFDGLKSATQNYNDDLVEVQLV